MGSKANPFCTFKTPINYSIYFVYASSTETQKHIFSRIFARIWFSNSHTLQHFFKLCFNVVAIKSSNADAGTRYVNKLINYTQAETKIM